MRMTIRFGAILGALVVALWVVAPMASGGIAGTAHDFSGDYTAVTDEICIFCHTPHNAVSGVEPLWNHGQTAASFTLYSSSTLDATLGQPSDQSKLCLSCHDGTVAIDTFGGNTGSATISGDANLGTDLSDDHPVSFTYTATSPDDPGLKDPPTDLPLFGSSSDQLECATCHDPHDDTNGAFLRASNTASALCLKCHDK